jgi:multidrug resistance efflux pump
LNTYKFNEESSKKQIELLYKDKQITKNSLTNGDELGQIGYNKTILSLEDQLSALETGLENAQITYDNALKTRTVSLKNLNNQIRNAKNSYSSAYKEYNKLSIRSPIDGIVGEISAQE